MEKPSNMIIYGKHPVIDAIKSGKTIEKVLLQKGSSSNSEDEIRKLAKEHDFPIQYVPKEKLNRITRNNHQGLVAYISAITYYDAEKLLNEIIEAETNPVVLILDGVTDVRNFGAIARSAECTGVSAIILQQKGSAPANAEAIKASAGALMKVKIGRINSFAHLIGFLQNTGWQVLASDLKAKKPLKEVDFSEPTAIVIGSESYGVSRYVLKAVDETFIIPQVGQTDSFNVSVATGIILYEAMNQKAAANNS